MSENLTLEKPDVRYKDSFVEHVKECLPYLEKEENSKTHWWQSIARLEMYRLQNDFDEYIVKDRLDVVNGSAAKEWNTEYHQYWIIKDGKEFLGVVDLRPQLNTPFLQEIAGHLGLMLRPSACGKGYGLHAIGLARRILRKRGVHRFMITCNVHNDPSRKMIEKSIQLYGGAYDSTIEKEYDGKHWHTMRYWVENG